MVQQHQLPDVAFVKKVEPEVVLPRYNNEKVDLLFPDKLVDCPDDICILNVVVNGLDILKLIPQKGFISLPHLGVLRLRPGYMHDMEFRAGVSHYVQDEIDLIRHTYVLVVAGKTDMLWLLE